MAGRPARAATRNAEPGVQRCINVACAATYGLRERVYLCPRCGETLEIVCRLAAPGGPMAMRKLWSSRRALGARSEDARDVSGVWRYLEMLPFEEDAPFVTLFEGNTPLYDAPRSAAYCGIASLRLKHQGYNPTGSFKDTGMAAAMTQAMLSGARTAVCASTGNTAASLAAYAARSGLKAAILLPRGQVSPSKLAQSLDYGALVLEIDGNFDACMRLVEELGGEPSIYIANSINPFRIEGQKTVAFELIEQCRWRVPDHVVVPGGNMGNSTALGKGFQELLSLGMIDRLPKLSVIQAEGAAPLAHLFANLDLKKQAGREPSIPSKLEPVHNPQTLATAIKIGAPVSWKKALRAVLRSGGQIISVSEQELADAKAMIGRDSIGCEPASATTVAGIKKLVATGHIARTDDVIAVLTGHALKDPDYMIRYHEGGLSSDTGGKRDLAFASALRNTPKHAAATKAAILSSLEQQL
ncbi:MAG TPA: threonine synthase [Candidatus Acidoferrales bacterium]|nr:threonine synthase [Candidatus Acidoferrales bacterium]